MVKKRGLLIALVVAVASLVPIFIFSLNSDIGVSKITGFFAFSPEDEQKQEDLENDGFLENDIGEVIPLSDSNGSEQSDGSSSGGRGGRGYGSQGSYYTEQEIETIEERFRIFGLESGYELYRNGALVSENSVFSGRHTFEIRKEGFPVALFDLIFDRDINLSGARGSTDISLNSSLFIFDSSVVKNVYLFVPRGIQDNLVYYCSNFIELFDSVQCSSNISIANSSSQSLIASADGNYFLLSVSNSTYAYSGKEQAFGQINLLTPLHAVLQKQQISFQYLISSSFNASSCSLVMGEKNYTDYSYLGNDVYAFSLSNLSVGDYFWSVRCYDGDNNSVISQDRKTSVFRATDYGGNTTDLSLVSDLSRVENFMLEKQGNGFIRYRSPLNLSRAIDFDSHVVISHNFISVDSESVPELNASAELTFYGVERENPVIFRDGEICNDCQIINNNGDLTFLVNHFSSYTSSENSQLEIYDTTDSEVRYITQQIDFFANYTNVSDSTPIQGGGSSCSITFDDTGTSAMTYNAVSGLYEYDRTFSNPGAYDFDVSCTGAPIGFTNLETSDTTLVSPQGSYRVRGASVTETRTETAPDDLAETDESFAGNLSELILTGFSTTQSWQGYFGNVSGAVELTDSLGNTFYNWTLTEPEGEVYASVISTISWTDVQCFNFTALGNHTDETGNGGTTSLYGTNLSQLEAEYGLSSDDVDGVDETFTLSGAGTHDAFFTASQAFSEGECRSTRVYGSSGAGVNNEFEEVLLYDPLTRAVIFTSLLEESVVAGFDGVEYDFEMLVLEDGHGTDTDTTTYYFFVELE